MYFSTLLVVAASALAVNAAAVVERGFWHYNPHKQVNHTVTVGDLNGDLMFNPPTLSANPGDYVFYVFKQKNHSTTQSESLFQPCTNKAGGIDLGFHPVAPGQTDNLPTIPVLIKDKFPLYFHCRQGENTNASHCGQGMVHIVNPLFDGEFNIFQQEALAVGRQLGVPQKH
ncbi:hypothetical protein PsYK624_095340 [Phanerochaete sordida]|uniref:Extracellular serine-rich protein n=1 Tax=Phanerochaete sordida TaxID=48140 RepID=A0A9P3GGP2_9APHY|nr:hypothetical protein PsYK624_095340 [Phanerochaete sordida]